jgi:hypothetical protein
MMAAARQADSRRSGCMLASLTVRLGGDDARFVAHQEVSRQQT